jgi:hypothetical protein
MDYAPKRMVALSEIVDAKWIAERAGVTRAAVGNWKARYDDFPEPLHTPRVTNPLYDQRAVEAFLARYPHHVHKERH